MKFGKEQNEIFGTLVCLIFMKKFMLDEFKTWELVFDKGLKWLLLIKPKKRKKCLLIINLFIHFQINREKVILRVLLVVSMWIWLC